MFRKLRDYFPEAPGRRHPGSTGSIDPEDYAEIGGLWEALDRKNVSFYNFGEANETAHVTGRNGMIRLPEPAHGVMVPMQKALFRQDKSRLCRIQYEYTGSVQDGSV